MRVVASLETKAPDQETNFAKSDLQLKGLHMEKLLKYYAFLSPIVS
jgi:hypothetical protein